MLIYSVYQRDNNAGLPGYVNNWITRHGFSTNWGCAKSVSYKDLAQFITIRGILLLLLLLYKFK